MKESTTFWFYVRLALVALSVPIWLAIRSAMPDDFSQPPKWYFPCILIGFSLFSVFALSVLRSESHWQTPNWHANPLDHHRPLEGLHLTGWSFILGSFGLFFANLFYKASDWSWVLPGCIGLGLLLGVRLLVSRSVS